MLSNWHNLKSIAGATGTSLPRGETLSVAAPSQGYSHAMLTIKGFGLGQPRVESVSRRQELAAASDRCQFNK